MLKTKKLAGGIFRINNGESKSLLSRYKILNDEIEKKFSSKSSVKISGDDILVGLDKSEVKISVIKSNKGYKIEIPLLKKERLFGMGDATRDSVMVRGTKCIMDVANVSSYGPMPILISDRGYTIIINSTYAQVFDNGFTDKNKVVITVSNGEPDLYIVCFNDFKDNLDKITEITGKPIMLPAFGYGLTIVQNEKIDIKGLLDNVMNVRDRKIPCDVFGLEPYWMSVYYDETTDKKWNPDLFPMPSWHGDGYAGPQSFLFPLRDKGMQLSLWLGENYDLFFEEEKNLEQVEFNDDTNDQKEAYNYDAHLNNAKWTDRVTKRDEPWFKHLEKFVDNGAACFKLDGYSQVLKHPDRYWGLKYHDDEIHNLYPVVLSKQMKEGFVNHTDRRSMVYTSGAYLGIQKYAATWAGDTGGGARPLVSLLNYAMVGHTNATCDLDITLLPSMHYSFLLAFSQQDVWGYWFYPWYVNEKREEAFRFYSTLRSSLFPYIYSFAHNASVTGFPVVRPLPLAFPDTDRFDNVKNGFMLGDSLLVYAAFTEDKGSKATDYVDSDDYKTAKSSEGKLKISLPDGEWIDYFDGKIYSGDINYKVLEGKGGALFVRAGSVFTTMKPQLYILEKEHDYIINVYLGGNGKFTLYEDDGFTYDYKDGGYATTDVVLTDKKGGAELTVEKRVGSFKGRPNNGHDEVQNSIPKISGTPSIKDIPVIIKGKKVKSITLDGKEIDFTFNGKDTEFIMDKKLHSEKELKYKIIY